MNWKEVDYNAIDWTQLNRHQKESYYDSLRKTANRRIRRLREANLEQPFFTSAYLRRMKRKTFTKIGEKIPEWRLNEALAEVISFLTNERSTISGYKKIARELAAKLGAGDVSMDDIYNFMKSREFKNLRHYIDSKLLVEDFSEAIRQGMDKNDIMEEYRSFLSGEITKDELLEKREHVLEEG